MSDRDPPFDILVELVRQRLPGVRAIYAFGSTICGRARPDSDVDLAVLGEAPLTDPGGPVRTRASLRGAGPRGC